METTSDFHFLSLVMTHQQAALMHMGKMANPVSGEVERNLDAARYSIEVLESLERKTKGNLNEEEARALQEALTHLRLNFVDEAKQEPASEEEEQEPSPAGDET
ncbi:MAG: DUF1844 domain-containing protein [Candidatus Krumholzibacteria bacterium]|nr:DUF1844 domain-containing protein [Candidatus Krumholzibacteria bacterium]MDP6669125.1 DUF1844 domain-containing protein [Candidatus Krumholzibacteria bacterium]MDP6797707.1 DUF1844 domain-containing protein [Candidatus Krumholzibacteria bacterium]MDP7022556.1 DUF1844 domain-containing protein [Candidatus Krumholzibacteria bacterium]